MTCLTRQRKNQALPNETNIAGLRNSPAHAVMPSIVWHGISHGDRKFESLEDELGLEHHGCETPVFHYCQSFQTRYKRQVVYLNHPNERGCPIFSGAAGNVSKSELSERDRGTSQLAVKRECPTMP